MREIRMGSTAESFRNIARRRRGRVTNLAAEPEVPLNPRRFDEPVEGDFQVTRELPAHQLSKVTRTSHAP
jgi:hypothetical protein